MKKTGSRKSVAHKLTLRAALLLLAALLILSIGSFHAVRNTILEENTRYAKTVVSMYGDLINYEAEKANVPIDENFHDQINVFSQYVCNWYSIDYIYLCAVNPENSMIRYLDFCAKDPDWSAAMEGIYKDGLNFPLDPLMQELSDQVVEYGVADYSQGLGTIEITMKISDSFGNVLIAGVAVSVEEMMRDVLGKFLLIVSILLLIFILLTFILYFTVVKDVSNPAKQISKAMNEFITDGKRVKLLPDVSSVESRNDEFGMIATAFSSMTADIDNYLKDIRSLNEAKADQKSQMETASFIQKGFLPPENYITGDFEVHAIMNPAKDIGGDLYDYLQIDNDRLLLVIADVSGKGMAASLFMSVTLMLIRQYARNGISPAKILENVNNTLSVQNPRLLFATAFIGIYNRRTKEMTCASAGHTPPCILHDGLRKPVSSQNTILGLFPDEKYEEETLTLKTGDILFLYTDGVDEATDSQNRFFGTERLEQTLLETRVTHEENLIGHVLDVLTGFVADAEQHDDITMITLTVKDTRQLELSADTREFPKIRETILRCNLPHQLKLDLCVAAEEIFINICSYAFGEHPSPEQKIFFTLEHSDRITLRFTDSGTPYDPRENVVSAEDYDMDLQIGGLGKLIAFTVADKVDYEYTDGQNILTVTKYIKEEN